MYKMEIMLVWNNEYSERSRTLYSRLFKSIEKAQNYADEYVCKRYHRSNVGIEWNMYDSIDSALGIVEQDYNEVVQTMVQ